MRNAHDVCYCGHERWCSVAEGVDGMAGEGFGRRKVSPPLHTLRSGPHQPPRGAETRGSVDERRRAAVTHPMAQVRWRIGGRGPPAVRRVHARRSANYTGTRDRAVFRRTTPSCRLVDRAQHVRLTTDLAHVRIIIAITLLRRDRHVRIIIASLSRCSLCARRV